MKWPRTRRQFRGSIYLDSHVGRLPKERRPVVDDLKAFARIAARLLDKLVLEQCERLMQTVAVALFKDNVGTFARMTANN